MTAGPGDRMAAAAAARGRLRASHADREHVVGVLKAAFVQGRLTKDEFDLRVGQTLASRTYAELAALTADIPAWLTDARPRQPAGAQSRPPAAKVAVAVAGGLLAPAILAFAVATNNPQLGKLFFMPTMLTFMAWLVAGAVMLDSWHQKRSRRQLPPRPGQRSQALEDERDRRPGGDLILSEVCREVRAPHPPGHGVIKRTLWSLT